MPEAWTYAPLSDGKAKTALTDYEAKAVAIVNDLCKYGLKAAFDQLQAVSDLQVSIATNCPVNSDTAEAVLHCRIAYMALYELVYGKNPGLEDGTVVGRLIEMAVQSIIKARWLANAASAKP